MFRLLSLSLRFTALQRRLLQLSSLLSVLFWGSDDMRHGPALCKPQGLGESGGYTESLVESRRLLTRLLEAIKCVSISLCWEYCCQNDNLNQIVRK